MSSPSLYPLRFEPTLKPKIWGGEKLKTKLNKYSEQNQLGESWEISGVKEDISVVTEGELKGWNLKQILKIYQDKLVGKKVYDHFADEFPLLIKFIDATDTLSVQLHPDDNLAKQRHNSFGKTEMWYVVDHEKDGFIIADFKDKLDENQLKKHIKEGNLQDQLKSYHVQKGDSFFITPGLVHAIGKGVLLAEIQQTSDITYRLYDWDRKDDQGNARELHIKESLDAIDYSLSAHPKVDYDKNQNETLLVENKYFTTNRLKVDKPFELELAERDSFTILMSVQGKAQIKYDQNYYSLNIGDTLLIPSSLNCINIFPDDKSIILDIHINQ